MSSIELHGKRRYANSGELCDLPIGTRLKCLVSDTIITSTKTLAFVLCVKNMGQYVKVLYMNNLYLMNPECLYFSRKYNTKG